MDGNNITNIDLDADQNATSVEADAQHQFNDKVVVQNKKFNPKIEFLTDIHNKSEEIIKWCKENPIADHIYEFKRLTIHNGERINCIKLFDIPDMYIAGSYALRDLLDYLDRNCRGCDNFGFNWYNNDIDLFLLNQKTPMRNDIGPKLDIILSPEKSVQELLLGFDLPVCRVAISLDGTYYVSIQAMNSILTRKMNIPIYLKNIQTAYMIIESYCQQFYLDKQDDKKPLPQFLIDRFFERLRKYSGRGFGVNWIDTKEIIDWIKMRSAYAASRMINH